MNFPYECQIAWRYMLNIRNKSKRNFFSFVTFISISGIALGVSILIIVLSVMNGFHNDIRSRILSMFAHIEITSPIGFLINWKSISKQVEDNEFVINSSPYIDTQALIATNNGSIHGSLIRGVDPKYEKFVSDITKTMKIGNLDDLIAGKYGIILGSGLSNNLNISIGDEINLILLEKTISLDNFLSSFNKFTVVGIFESGYNEYDNSLVFTNIFDAQSLSSFPGITGIRLRIKDINNAPKIAKILKNLLSDDDVYVQDWSEQNKIWFSAIQVEKRLMFIVLTLIIVVAIFNLISSLVMTVINKKSDIAILKTLGAKSSSVILIFVIKGMIIGIIGTIIGVCFGCLISWKISWIVTTFDRIFDVQYFNSSLYFFGKFPSKIMISDIGLISLISLVFSAIATIYPSWYGSKIRPAEALRYE